MITDIRIRTALIAFAALVQTSFAAPETWIQSVIHGGETVTMRLTRESLRGSEFELWAQNSVGGYDVTIAVEERSYMGSVDGHPGAVACGILKDDGQFRGAVYFDRGATWFTLGTAVVNTRALDYEDFEAFQFPGAPCVGPGQAGTTTYAYDLAIDADFDYFSNAGSSVAKAFEGIEYSVCLVRAIYMRDVLLRPRLGRVIIRSALPHDPYTGLSQGDYLSALRSEWNANHNDTNTDLVAGISPSKIGGGLAWVGVVGSSSKYSVNQSNSDGEFDVVFRHEMGHNWGCNHFVGGSPEGAGLMGGNQPGRFSGCEAHRVFNHRDAKIAEGGILDSEGIYTAIELPPYAGLDSGVFVQTISSPKVFNVLANDHDANGQSLSLVSFDATSARGGAVTRQGNNLIYSPQGAFVGTDFFHYTITDTANRTATGVCIVDVQPNDPMLVYLPLNDTGGTMAEDCSSYARTYNVSGTDFPTASITGRYGEAINFDGVDDHIELSGVHLDANRLTLTAWVKQGASQSPWAGIIFDRANATVGLNVGDNGELRYHWMNDYWGWNPNLRPPTGTWTFVALVIEPSQATMYMNSGAGFQSAVNPVSHAVASFSSPYVGWDSSQGTRHFMGGIDDARIYNYALSPTELQKIYAGGGTSSPTPFDGATDVRSTLVSWCPDTTAMSHDVYLGTNLAAVANATPSSSEFMDTTTSTSVLLPLDPLTQYYWRVDAVTPSGTVQGSVWAFATAIHLESITDDLVTHLTMDSTDTAGSTVSDTSGLPHYNGTIVSSSGNPAGQIKEALRLNGVSDLVTLPAMNLNSDTVTLSAWIRRDGTQADWAGIIFSRAGSTVAGLNFGDNHDLRYHWNQGQWSWDSGLVVPDAQWVHVALVVEPGGATIYLNGVASTHSAAHGVEEFDGLSQIGKDQNLRYFKGDIDDVAVWSRALPQSQIAFIHEQGLAGRSFASRPDNDGDGDPDDTDLDDDNDGMPDIWETNNSLDPLFNDKGEDPDIDLQDNWHEYVADTDPQNPQSIQTFSITLAPATGLPTVRFRTSADRRYAVEFRDNLNAGNWQNLNPAFLGDGTEITVSDPAPDMRGYYRLRIELP